jgi:hypothetical protein
VSCVYHNKWYNRHTGWYTQAQTRVWRNGNRPVFYQQESEVGEMTQENERSSRLIVGLIVGAVFGLGIGLLFGYVIAPVKWVDGAPQDLRVDYAANYWRFVTQSYSEHGNLELAQQQLGEWNDPDRLKAALDRAHIESSPDQQQALQSLSNKLVVVPETAGPVAEATQPAEPEEGVTGLKINWGTFLLTLLLILLILVAIGLFVSRARKARSLEGEPVEAPAVRLDQPLPATDQLEPVGPDAPPLAHFKTTYTQAKEYYDEALPIETETGEYLGECGVGIAERLDEDATDRVTAIEVFLFDKNAISTVTKVLVSEYAYNDEQLRRSLMEKGDVVLAQLNQPIVLETATVRVDAEITDMAYGTDDPRPNSYFESLSTELVIRQVGPIIDRMSGPPDEIDA